MGQAGAPTDYELTDEMIEVGRRALIEWHQGSKDFDQGAASVFRAMLLGGGYDVREESFQPDVEGAHLG